MADAVEQFRDDFLAFWRGRYKSLPLSTTSLIAVTKGGQDNSHPRPKMLERLEAVAALGCVSRRHYAAYAVAWAYDFEGGSRHREQVAKKFHISLATFTRRVREFWEALFLQCHGVAPGVESSKEE